MRRTTRVFALAVVLSLVAVPAATADKPVFEPVTNPPLTGNFCPGFAVTITATSKETAKTFSSGATIVTGSYRAGIENLTSGQTVDVNASGPVFFSADGSTVTLRGRTLLFGEAGDLGAGSPPQVLEVSGVVTVTLDSAGQLVSITTRGAVRDICAELAA
jgi:hypothetical protein